MKKFVPLIVAVLSVSVITGCSADGTLTGITTASINGEQSKADPACLTLAKQIDGLRHEGVAMKIEKAAAGDYKMSKPDLLKADELTKANAEFKTKCVPKALQHAVGPADTSQAAVAPQTKQ